MALTLNTLILEDEIYFAKGLSDGHPVFLLEGFHEEAIVVKAEGDANLGANARNTSIHSNARVIAAVDPQARQVVMTPPEVQALHNWVEFILANPPPVDLKGVRAMREELRTPKTWFKMEPRALKDLKGAIESRIQGDKSDVRVIAKALNRAGGLEKLGAIAAADLFNGSNDRFDPQGGVPHSDYGIAGGGTFNHLRNVGNVFVACEPGNLARPIGLDSYDYTSLFRDMTQDISGQEDELAQWFGRILGDAGNAKQNRNAFAQGCIHDLEAALGPRNRKRPLATTRRLNRGATRRFRKGMEAGAQEIRRSLAPQKPTLPLGLRSRMDLLGW